VFVLYMCLSVYVVYKYVLCVFLCVDGSIRVFSVN